MTQDQISQGALDNLKETEGYRVRVEQSGYIQYIDPESMLAAASEKDLVVRLLRKPGDFVWRGTAVALVWPAAQAAGQPEEQIRRSFQVGHQTHPHPGCRIRRQSAGRNGRPRHVAGDQRSLHRHDLPGIYWRWPGALLAPV